MIQTLDQQFKIGMCFITNGRLSVMEQTMPNIYENVIKQFEWDWILVIDDSAQPDSWQFMDENVWQETHQFIGHDTNEGLAKTVQHAWTQLAEQNLDYIFHVEDDFLFCTIPPIQQMIEVLEAEPDLSQMILKRNPVNDHEARYGGYIQANPSAFLELTTVDVTWMRHCQFFSLNPAVIPRKIFADIGWPDTNEAGMIEQLRQMNYWSGVYGSRYSEPVVEHVGFYRPSWWKL